MAELAATILIPTTGDRGPLLPYSVGSVLKQSVREIEVFIIGDGVDGSTRRAVNTLIAKDPRIRFFDHPKDIRRGEVYRHEALAEARGEVVCYLCDRDLMLPNHVETMRSLLSDADFGHSLRFTIRPNGKLQFNHNVDLENRNNRKNPQLFRSFIPLSFAAHTMDMYRRLPHGWRTTPGGIETDRYMWLQFLEQSKCRIAVSTLPTILYFKRGSHALRSVEKRMPELKKWYEDMLQPGFLPPFIERARHEAIRDRGRLKNNEMLAREKSRWRTSLRRREDTGNNKFDPRLFTVHNKLELSVYWLRLNGDEGPAASLYLHNDEIMRFDCFLRDAHMHINMNQSRLAEANSTRWVFPAGTVGQHVDRAVFELTNNLPYVLRTNLDSRIRKFRVPPNKLQQAGRWMENQMLDLCNQYLENAQQSIEAPTS
jgi:glycosyltransferase involved in cell wall biosynthesis